MTETIDFLLSIQGSLAFGDAKRNILAAKGTKREVIFTDASCKPVQGMYNPRPDCATVFDGILGHGSQNMVLESVDLFRRTIVMIENTNTSDPFSAVNQTMNSYEMEKAKVLLDDYALPVFAYIRLLAYGDAIDSVNSVYLSRVVMLAAFVIFSVLLFVFYFVPLIYLLNEEQKQTISLLLLIPEEMYANFQFLVEF